MPETEHISLNVKSIIGTGAPSDIIMLIPLISQWGVPRECAYGALTGEKCEDPIRRLYCLAEKVQGFSVIGVCAKHHLELHGPDTAPEEGEGDGA